MPFESHPTVRRVSQRIHDTPTVLDGAWLRQLATECGADDVGLVDLARPALDPQRDEILANYPWTRSLLSFVVRMARAPVRGAPRSVANLEFHRAGEEVNVIGAAIVARLEARGIQAVNPSMGFPMEMYRVGAGVVWLVSHKPIAVEAGLGHMGIHRNLIHPRFGNFVLLGTVLVGCDVTDYDHAVDYNPCLECKLCVAACPVGAIGPEGAFNFASCFTHNYREFLGGFSDWVEQVADARDALDYRRRISEPETASMWQSLSHGANYKSAYCMAVCPAGEDVIGPYLEDRERHLRDVVRPLQERAEPVYVVPGSDAEAIARRRFKNKTVKPVSNGIRSRSIAGLIDLMPYVFQPNQSRGLDAMFHFTFTGVESRQVTITIRNRAIEVKDGLVGRADVSVTADAKTWLGFVAKEQRLVPALLRRRIRVRGNPKLLLAFGKCFPSVGPRRQHVEVQPQPTRLRPLSARYQRNDPATGKIRWVGVVQLSGIDIVTHDVKTFRFTPPGGGDIPFQYLPGQFLTLHLTVRGHPIRRSYTIASSPTWRDRIEITVKRESHGVVSRFLHDELKVGDEVEIEAPNGTFVFDGSQAERLALIAAGVGITPMMSVARYLTETGWLGSIALILGFRAARDFIFRDELEQLTALNPNMSVTVTMSQPEAGVWLGRRGRIDAELLATVADLALRTVHICGPPAMMDSVRRAVRELGVDETRIKTEAFGTVTRDPSAKRVRASEIGGTVMFQASDTSVQASADATVLDVADGAGVFIDSACRSGTCGSCRVKLVSGDVRMAVDDALTAQDKEDGYILACQATVRGAVRIDA
jgi:ferredoxin-NADP reductase/Fe-S-cluster-containing hydrogenase component 2